MIQLNVLFVSIDGLISGIAHQAVKEGHNIKLHIIDSKFSDIADGFVPKSVNWKKDVKWADLIVFDDIGYAKEVKRLKKQNKLVVGGTHYTDKLEHDRTFGQNELKKHGVPIALFKEFRSFDDAIKFVESHPTRYVIKPSGDAQNTKHFIFVGKEKNGQDVINVLKTYKKKYAKKIEVFQLQERIIGVEVAVGAFFNGKKFIRPININFENKPMFPGNVGLMTGETGTSMFWSKDNKFFKQTLARFEKTLSKEKYIGYIDLNCIVNKDGIFPLEFTSRFGYPCVFIQAAGIEIPIVEFLHKMASGKLKKFKAKKGLQIGVRLFVPPYPLKNKKIFETFGKNKPILFKKHNFKGLYIEEVKLVDNNWTVAGAAGVVLVVVATGKSLKKVQHRLYSRLKNIMLPNSYYRNDIGNDYYEKLNKCKKWGYLN